MTVSVVTPASTTDLVDLESVKGYLQITDNAQDGRLEQLITRASGSFVDYLGRPLALQTYRERQTIQGRIPGINLSNGPIAAILSASVDGVAWTGALDECDVEREGARIMASAFLPPRQLCFTRPVVVEIIYIAGFMLPGMDKLVVPDNALLPWQATPLPAAISGGCLSTIQMLLGVSGRDPLLKSENIQGVGSASYATLDPATGGLSADAVASLSRLSIMADWMA
ncbi:phage head-tail connector protein [Acetobacter okinawensis]|uniref:phage head-tail connector protein n=1 Tax=Acetobacter okinawensis TaxID=1076594 RepID=UPI0039ECC63C